MRAEIKPRFLVIGLLTLAFGLALTSAVLKSPTMDEQNHIARGVAYLGTGDPRLSIEHPPLVNGLSGLLPHLLLDLHLPLDTVWWEAAEWYHFADLLLWEVNPNAEQIIFLARLPIIGLGMILIALVFRWATTRFGPWGGAAGRCFLRPGSQHLGPRTPEHDRHRRYVLHIPGRLCPLAGVAAPLVVATLAARPEQWPGIRTGAQCQTVCSPLRAYPDVDGPG